jgi:phosphopantetheinyl transferase
MPMAHKHITEEYSIAVWHTTEDLEQLRQTITLDNYTKNTLKTCKVHRCRELIGTRHLLNVLLGESVTITKGENGRPMIVEYPDLNISLSHSGDYSAVMLSRVYSRIGIDIQMHRESISKIAPKFMTMEEVQSTSVSQQHFYWGIKESVFKAWSKGGVDFTNMIKVSPFDLLNDSRLDVATTTLFCKDDVSISFNANGLVLDDLYLSWVTPTETTNQNPQ